MGLSISCRLTSELDHIVFVDVSFGATAPKVGTFFKIENKNMIPLKTWLASAAQLGWVVRSDVLLSIGQILLGMLLHLHDESIQVDQLGLDDVEIAGPTADGFLHVALGTLRQKKQAMPRQQRVPYPGLRDLALLMDQCLVRVGMITSSETKAGSDGTRPWHIKHPVLGAWHKLLETATRAVETKSYDAQLALRRQLVSIVEGAMIPNSLVLDDSAAQTDRDRNEEQPPDPADAAVNAAALVRSPPGLYDVLKSTLPAVDHKHPESVLDPVVIVPETVIGQTPALDPVVIVPETDQHPPTAKPDKHAPKKRRRSQWERLIEENQSNPRLVIETRRKKQKISL